MRPAAEHDARPRGFLSTWERNAMGNLVFTRREKQGVVIDVGGELVFVTVVKTGVETRLAFEAAKNVVIDRSEVWQRKQVQKGASK